MNLTPQYFKRYLFGIYKPTKDFELIITSKTPKTKYGYYRICKQRIVIHYIGSRDIESLHKIAIHELAHHIHYTELDCKAREERPHGKEFYLIFNALMLLATQKGVFSEERLQHLLKHRV